MIDFIKRKIHNLIYDKKFSEILTGSAWAIGAHVISNVLIVVTSIIIARVYGAEMMGIVAMINSFLMLAMTFTVLGTNTSILRLIPEYSAKYSVASAYKVYRKIQYFVAGVSVITGGLLFWGSNLIADKVFSKPHLSFFFALAAVFVLFVSLMKLNTQAVRSLRLIRTFALMELFPALSKLLILVGITIFFFNPNNPIYALFASFLVTALFGVFIVQSEFKKKMDPSDSIHDIPMKNILSISLPMLMTMTMNLVIGQIGVIMLGMFRSEAEVGYYAVAVKLATLTVFVLQAVNSMAAPKFSELFQAGKMEELFYVAKKSAKLIFWITAPILVTLILLGKTLLGVLFGQEFTVAYWAMVLLVIGQFVNAISGSTGLFMNMIGHQKAFRNIIICAAVLNVSLNLALIPRFGIYGTAFVGMISIAFWNIFTLLFIKMRYGKIIGYLPCLRRQ